MRFLVADNNSLNRRLLVILLEKLGYEVDEFSQLDELLPRIISEDYTAIFVDIVMPRNNGYHFVRSLRAEPQTADQYVVFYSDPQTPLQIDYGIKRVGANDFLSKPVDQDKLIQVLRKIPGFAVQSPFKQEELMEGVSQSVQPKPVVQTIVTESAEGDLESATEAPVIKYRGVEYAKESQPQEPQQSQPSRTVKRMYRGVEID